MSFSSHVKEELSVDTETARHCSIAELSAIFGFCGKVEISEWDEISVSFKTENLAVARKCFTLLKKTFKQENALHY